MMCRVQVIMRDEDMAKGHLQEGGGGWRGGGLLSPRLTVSATLHACERALNTPHASLPIHAFERECGVWGAKAVP
jgi:hypothetical protein